MGCYTKGYKPASLNKERFSIDGESYVNVRELTSADLVWLQERYPKDDASTRYDLACDQLALTLADDEGKRIFESGADVKANFQVGLSTIWKLQKKVFELSSLPDKEKN